MHIRPFQPADTEAVVSLWNDPYRDIQRKLAEQPELFLVGEVDGVLMAIAAGSITWRWPRSTSAAAMPGDWWRPPNSCSPSAAAPSCS